jgi:hypothetical protein
VEILIFILFIGLAIAVAIYSSIAARKRREELAALANRLGLSFDEQKDRAMADRFQFLNHLARGSNRYAFNRIAGTYRGHEVLVFDYHYETESRDSKGNRTTDDHYFSCFILLLPGSFPELRIGREGMMSKIAQAFGYDDIDFESAEFSRKFCVRSRNKKFAYDFCNPRMIEYLLENSELDIEVENQALALAFSQRLSAPDLEANFARLLAVRERLPDYIFNPP